MIKNFNSKKFFILLTIVCLLFLILVVNAFMYIPKNMTAEDVSSHRAETVNRQLLSKAAVPQEEKSSNTEEQKVKTEKTVKYKLPTDADGMDIVEIDAPPGVDSSKDEKPEPIETNKELTPDEQSEVYLKEAAKYRASQQYIKALDEYQKVLNTATDKKYTAKAYDGIASLYAINKRHGSALSFAIKAYNMYPTTERELTLARLYYKTGDLAKATQRVNNILRREFSDDKW